MKKPLCVLPAALLCLACLAVAPPTTQPQQDEMMISSANRKIKATLAELHRESSVVHLRLVAEIERAQRHAQSQQEQARLDLAAKTALAMKRLARGTQDKGPEMRQAFATELAQASQALTQRLAEIDAEQNQAIAQAVQRFAQQKAELINAYPKEVQAAVQRLTQELAAPDMSKSIASFSVTLPSYAVPADPSADVEFANAYRTGLDAAAESYTQAMDEARTKVVGTIEQSLDAVTETGTNEEQSEQIRNAVKRLGLWAADSMDTYQIALRSALRKYQLAENRPQTEAKTQ